MKVLKSSEAGCDWIVENVIQVLVKELFLKKHSKITVRTLVSLTQRFPQVMWTAMPLFLLTIASIESDFLRFQMYILLEELSHFKSIDVEVCVLSCLPNKFSGTGLWMGLSLCSRP
jgi:hypothetical protein